MKKLLLSLAVAGMFAFLACGPSAEEVAEQARLDSLKADSIMKAAADSIAAIEKAMQDSIAAAAADTTQTETAEGGE